MKERFLKLAIASSFGLLAGTPALLSADECYDSCYSSCNSCCEEQCFAVFADYLYWNVCPSSLSFATENIPGSVTLNPPAGATPINLIDPVNGLGGVKDHHCTTKYRSGFRVGFAYHMPDQWDFEASYTYFHPSYKGTRHTSGTNYFAPCGLPNYRVTSPVALTATAVGTAVTVPVQTVSILTTAEGPTALTFLTGEPATAAPVTGFITGSTLPVVGTPAGLATAVTDPLVTVSPSPLTLPVAVPNIPFNAVKVHADIKYDIVDLLLARRYDCGGCFDYVPYIGARIFSFEQEVCSHFAVTGSANSGAVSSGNYLLSTKHKLKLPSAGLTFGSRLNYAICDCFNLFGHIGASILGGSAKQHYTWDNSLLNIALTNALPTLIANGGLPAGTALSESLGNAHRHSKHCQVIFGLDVSAGISYEWCLCNLPVLLGVGYEAQSWWNMPQSRGADASCAKGATSLTVQGLFVRVGLGF